tara:strand:+ start:30 stop:998 length:969 start_codon:yes stop_codon:yes gene_type:complete
MTNPTVFIDGQEGTTGLRIREMLEGRKDIELLLIPESQRKNEEVRATFINNADLVILCLPDDAASEALKLVNNPATKIIDTSTTRRVSPDWIYGLPEISAKHREKISNASRVANCGCYPVSFILAVRPLVLAGLISPDVTLMINAVSGYSGGGRKMIEAFDKSTSGRRPGDANRPFSLYSLGARHKHIAEMWKYTLIDRPPMFVPSVIHTYCGMMVSIPLPSESLTNSEVDHSRIYALWKEAYDDAPMVRIIDPDRRDKILRQGFLDVETLGQSNEVELSIWGDDRGLILVGRLDNLGKGAAGNAVQCLNLMLGFEETVALT